MITFVAGRRGAQQPDPGPPAGDNMFY